jgi:hypothetical protein
MAVTRRVMRGTDPRVVFDVLRDGDTYASWVVGTRMIRTVEPGWPAPGTALHYTVGHGLLRKDDETRSLAYQPHRRLELEARAWPARTARIELRAEPVGDARRSASTSTRCARRPSCCTTRQHTPPGVDENIGGDQPVGGPRRWRRRPLVPAPFLLSAR